MGGLLGPRFRILLPLPPRPPNARQHPSTGRTRLRRCGTGEEGGGVVRQGEWVDARRLAREGADFVLWD
jgi:hypothetical protein